MDREPENTATNRLRRLVVLPLVAVLVAAAGSLGLYGALTASLPVLDGERRLPGLSAPVWVERDERGMPTVRAASRLDAARATGYLHAQDRFFQMDLLRRRAAGELAALLGARALPLDRSARVHRFRARAERRLAGLPAADGALLRAYTEGVRAGLADLGAPPFEHLVLRQAPAPWRAEDTLLVAYAMYLRLQEDDWERESHRGVLHDTLPPALYAFLVPPGTEWDAPVLGPALSVPPLPGPEVYDVRRRPRDPSLARATGSDEGRPHWVERVSPLPGSNAWAVGGAHTAHGRAMLANDMHLGLAVPNTWYRLSLLYPDTKGGERRVTGITLPGAPLVAAGSNGHLAWGMTNSYADFSDLVVLETDPGDPARYRTPDGWRRMETRREVIRVAGGEDVPLEVRETVWGPVLDRDHRGRPRALRWVAHDPAGVDLRMLALERTDTVAEALDLAPGTGVPGQNLVLADGEGHVGWTLLGRLPRRVGHDGRLPAPWADGDKGWDGYLEADAYPRLLDPPQGRIWSANQRMVGGQALGRLGDAGYDLGARAGQIRDALLALEDAGEADMLALQLDRRALFLARWRQLLLDTLDARALAEDPRRAELRALVEDWEGEAAVDSVAYRLVRAFRLLLAEQAFARVTAEAHGADPRFDYADITRFEGPLWRMVQARPEHLLTPGLPDWRARLLAAVDATLAHLGRDGQDLGEQTWGRRNTVRIEHPLGGLLPGLDAWLDMAAVQLPGDQHMPRVQDRRFGASMRLVVSPGREEQGLLHLPAGQSGHPLSPFYRSGQGAWARGEPTPLLPGSPAHRLRLTP